MLLSITTYHRSPSKDTSCLRTAAVLWRAMLSCPGCGSTEATAFVPVQLPQAEDEPTQRTEPESTNCPMPECGAM